MKGALGIGDVKLKLGTLARVSYRADFPRDCRVPACDLPALIHDCECLFPALHGREDVRQ